MQNVRIGDKARGFHVVCMAQTSVYYVEALFCTMSLCTEFIFFTIPARCCELCKKERVQYTFFPFFVGSFAEVLKSAQGQKQRQQVRVLTFKAGLLP